MTLMTFTVLSVMNGEMPLPTPPVLADFPQSVRTGILYAQRVTVSPNNVPTQKTVCQPWQSAKLTGYAQVSPVALVI